VKKQQNLSDVQAALDAVRLSAYCTNLQLTAVVVSGTTAAQQLLLYPGPDTAQVIQNINGYIEKHEDMALPEGLTYPLTERDIIGNPVAVDALLSNMDTFDRSNVLVLRD
jgi:hypothetical protein